VNCNPETVSTDYDTSDRLYFEPLTFEDVMSIVEKEKPDGVIVQFGGQTPLKLAVPLQKAGVKIIGTSPDSIDLAENRRRFNKLVSKLELRQPFSGTATTYAQTVKIAKKLGYPLLIRPSFVLGGRAMTIVHDEQSLKSCVKEAIEASGKHPILIDKFLDDATELDVDAISDGKTVVIGGIMEHIEEAGVHSGDSACSLPPISISKKLLTEIKRQTKLLALELKVNGLINIQFAVKNNDIYILEVNPRASRTIPYVSKSIGFPLAKMAAKVIVGKTLEELGLPSKIELSHFSVKEAVFPFDRFIGVDTILGPEMKSTGEVMGIDADFGSAYAKSQAAAKNAIPLSGKVFFSVKDKDKPPLPLMAKTLASLGFSLIATKGTAAYLKEHDIEVEVVNKVTEGRPHCVDLIKNKEIDMIINTVTGAKAQKDSFSLRAAALQNQVAYTTTIAGAKAAINAIEITLKEKTNIKSLQEYHC
ncbi:MAG: carbamoyl-phosphate synthase large subunit, partial [Anaerohalosphaera sp.]|nr:carbamoyl-phosphate synthase large subunit [Anaerohalosphaera sp.]